MTNPHATNARRAFYLRREVHVAVAGAENALCGVRLIGAIDTIADATCARCTAHRFETTPGLWDQVKAVGPDVQNVGGLPESTAGFPTDEPVVVESNVHHCDAVVAGAYCNDGPTVETPVGFRCAKHRPSPRVTQPTPQPIPGMLTVLTRDEVLAVYSASEHDRAIVVAEMARARGEGATIWGPCAHPLTDRLVGPGSRRALDDCKRCQQVRAAVEVLRRGGRIVGGLRAANVEQEALAVIEREDAAALAEQTEQPQPRDEHADEHAQRPTFRKVGEGLYEVVVAGIARGRVRRASQPHQTFSMRWDGYDTTGERIVLSAWTRSEAAERLLTRLRERDAAAAQHAQVEQAARELADPTTPAGARLDAAVKSTRVVEVRRTMAELDAARYDAAAAKPGSAARHRHEQRARRALSALHEVSPELASATEAYELAAAQVEHTRRGSSAHDQALEDERTAYDELARTLDAELGLLACGGGGRQRVLDAPPREAWAAPYFIG